MANNSELMNTLKHMVAKREKEQTELHNLNGRLASYIDKIRSLEQEVKQLKSHESKRVTELYEEEINKLRMEVKNQSQQSSSLKIDVEGLKESLQKANEEKEEALEKLAFLKEDLDAPTRASKASEAMIKSLQDQLDFRNKIHKEEIQQLQIRFEEMKNNDQTDGANSNLAEMMQELKAEFQNSTNAKISETEDRYKSQMSDMKEMLNENNETLTKLKQRNTNLENQNQKNLREINSLKDTIEEMEEKSQTLQETIDALETEKNKMKDDMKIQLLEYQDLLKEKGDLDREISIYRMLLEKEEHRILKNPEENDPTGNTPPQTPAPI
ncbi:desmin-like [Poeciliopsis prolifica]|uniref:desmin-like n=1 Tax=Poeciliopsis prolifica TaxID=188132 RepID=UPI002414157E|nr:desmin-like [Poeciliopsis prolifica]